MNTASENSAPQRFTLLSSNRQPLLSETARAKIAISVAAALLGFCTSVCLASLLRK